jgi:hypothetical protein
MDDPGAPRPKKNVLGTIALIVVLRRSAAKLLSKDEARRIAGEHPPSLRKLRQKRFGK